MEYVQAILAHPNLADFSLTEEQQHSLDAVDDARNQKDSKGSIQSTIAQRQNDLDSAEENFSWKPAKAAAGVSGGSEHRVIP